MRYVPDLIPESSRVLPDYFKGEVYGPTKQSPIMQVILWILGGAAFAAALFFLKHPILLLVLAAAGFLLIPPGHRYVEHKLQFSFTPKIRTVAASALFISSIPLTSHYLKADRQYAYQQKQVAERVAREEAIAAKKERIRQDSLNYYLQQSSRLVKDQKPGAASVQLDRAFAFASTDADKEGIEKAKLAIASSRAFNLVKTGEYKTALPQISSLLENDPFNSDLLYSRAVCYSKTGKIEAAVNDLKPLLETGNKEAEKLHNKINPIRRRVAYYVTRCWDGSTSNAKGRGACSHHGGVKNWNDPVYEEYRKYE